jgi:sarcosine oxidase gamma subunit
MGGDLDTSVFPVGTSAPTALHRIGVIIHLVDNEPTFDIYVYRGFAVSLWEILLTTALEFGCEVLPMERARTAHVDERARAVRSQ